jgi:hypothetical protein
LIIEDSLKASSIPRHTDDFPSHPYYYERGERGSQPPAADPVATKIRFVSTTLFKGRLEIWPDFKINIGDQIAQPNQL